MSPVAPRRSTSLTFSPVVITVGAIAFVAVMLGVLVASGLIDTSGWRGGEPSTAGLIAVPTPSGVIPAYTRLRRDHLWDARNRRLSVIYLPPKAVTKEMLLNITDILGRVLDHQKEPGYVFTDSDFLPPGTREGLVGGIPAGMRAIRVAADRVEGLYGLRAGDRFDIIATLPINAKQGTAMDFQGPHAPEIALEAQLTNWDKQATVRVIVQGASIVEPIATRGVLYQNSNGDNGAARTRAFQDAVIAITPEEVAVLTEAMAVNAKLTTVPRSGRPDDPAAQSRTPDRRPFSPFGGTGIAGESNGDGLALVETVMGQKRAVVPVPRP